MDWRDVGQKKSPHKVVIVSHANATFQIRYKQQDDSRYR